MHYTKLHYGKFLGVLLLMGTVEAKKIFLFAGKDHVSVVDTEDEKNYCIYGIPFEDHTLLAVTFDARPMTTCYIGQQHWLQMYASPSDIRDRWLEQGLDPAGRKVKAVRIFRRNEQLQSFYKLERVINLTSANPDAPAERTQLIGAQAPPPPLVRPAARLLRDEHRGVLGWDRYFDHGHSYWYMPDGRIDLALDFVAPSRNEPSVVVVQDEAHRDVHHERRRLELQAELDAILPPDLVPLEVWEGFKRDLVRSDGRCLVKPIVYGLYPLTLTSEQLGQVIRALPEHIRVIIRHFEVSRAALDVLPSEIELLPNLATIDAVGNRFSTLPPEIMALPRLRGLVIDSHVSVSPELAERVRVVRV